MKDNCNTENIKKIMSLDEMVLFIRKIGRTELYDELRFINNREYFNPINTIGRDSCYLKAVRASLISLNYDESWVEGPFKILLEYYYYDRQDDLNKYERNDFYKFYNVEKIDIFFETGLHSLNKVQETLYQKEFYQLRDKKLENLRLNINNTSKSKKVNQYDLNGKYIKTFNSITEANKYLKKPSNSSSINACCNGRNNSAFGYIWRFYDETENAKWKNIKLIIEEPIYPNSYCSKNIKEAYGFNSILEMLNYYVNVLNSKYQIDYNIFLPLNVNLLLKMTKRHIIIANSGKVTSEAEDFLKSKLAYKLLATESSKITIKVDEFEREMNIFIENGDENE